MAVQGVIRAVPGVAPAASSAASAPPSDAKFGDALQQLLAKVEESSETANASISRMVEGSGDVHEAMIALQHADLTLQFTVQVRNKLVQAYQEIMRMSV
jgi:flagellar hook-basal body complex protein FliE